MNIWYAISLVSGKVITVGMSSAAIFYTAVRIDSPQGAYAGDVSNVYGWMTRNGQPWEAEWKSMVDDKDLRHGELQI
jgi:hypothetical protein